MFHVKHSVSGEIPSTHKTIGNQCELQVESRWTEDEQQANNKHLSYYYTQYYTVFLLLHAMPIIT